MSVVFIFSSNSRQTKQIIIFLKMLNYSLLDTLEDFYFEKAAGIVELH